MMRNWSWLLISVAVSAQAEPPRQLEIVFTMSRNGSAMAEVVERLEYVQGNYKLTETWKGKGLYALLGSARRVSQELGQICAIISLKGLDSHVTSHCTILK